MEEVQIDETLDVSMLVTVGAVRLVHTDQFPNAFVARISADRPPPGSVVAGKGEYFVAYSRLCTHMGAHLVTRAHTGCDTPRGCVVSSVKNEGVVRCPCHLSCFDLRREGIVVMGQATARLAQIEIEGDAEKLKLIRWMTLPYGQLVTES